MKNNSLLNGINKKNTYTPILFSKISLDFKANIVILLQDQSFAFGTFNKLIRIVSAYTFKQVKSFEAHLYGISALTQLKDSRLVSCGSDRMVKLWDISTFNCLASFQAHYNAGIMLELKDKRLALGRYDIEIWDISSECTCVKIIEAHMNNITSLFQLKDQRLVSISKLERKSKIWSKINKKYDISGQELTIDVIDLLELTDGRLVFCENEVVQIVDKKTIEQTGHKAIFPLLQLTDGNLLSIQNKTIIVFEGSTFKKVVKKENQSKFFFDFNDSIVKIENLIFVLTVGGFKSCAIEIWNISP